MAQEPLDAGQGLTEAAKKGDLKRLTQATLKARPGSPPQGLVWFRSGYPRMTSSWRAAKRRKKDSLTRITSSRCSTKRFGRADDSEIRIKLK